MPRLILVAALVCAASPASAQTTSAPRWARVAFFDVGRVTSESQAGKAAPATLAALRNKREAEADERAKALRAEQLKLEGTEDCAAGAGEGGAGEADRQVSAGSTAVSGGRAR